VGVVRDDKDPPHRMKRSSIEESFTSQGFQMYRFKKPDAAA
jgi:hypothetical protein